MLNILFIFGTRPEAIKLAPLIKEFLKQSEYFSVKVCITAQHREMLDQVLNFFDIKVDFDLNLMRPNQSLFDITALSLRKLEKVLDFTKPDLIFVQGDTTTAFVGALAGFYKKIKVGHVEAGLRSFNKFSPYPEEMNRILITQLSDYHFAPTKKAADNLLKENKTKVWVTGNTVIDALFLGLKIIKELGEEKYYEAFNFLDFSKKIILVTSHRRENFGKPLRNICNALKELVQSFKDIEIVYPVHLNPNVQNTVFEILNGCERIYLLSPLTYSQLIWLMNKSYLILTDSGGIQEEAPSLGKPVLVMRRETERPEGLEAGTACLVGTSKEKILAKVSELLFDKEAYLKMAKATNPYGDGKASQRIVEIIKKEMIEYEKKFEN